MTTVVMRKVEGDVIAGWDSQTSRGNVKGTLGQDKVWVQDGIVYGFAGSLRVSDIIKATAFPEYDKSDPRLWIVKQWVPALLEAIQEDPFVFDKEEGLLKDVSLLMVVGGEVFDLDSALSPSSIQEGVYAIGSGAEFARGVLMSGGTVMQALTTAAACDVFTGGELTARSVGDMVRETTPPEPELNVITYQYPGDVAAATFHVMDATRRAVFENR